MGSRSRMLSADLLEGDHRSLRRTVLGLVVILALALAAPLFWAQMRAVRSPREIAEATFPSVVLLTMKDARGRVTSLGSGFFVRSDVIATNFHVIKSGVSGEAKVVAQNSRHALAGLVAADEARDLALLKTVKLTGPALPLGTDARPAVGDRVYVVGSPLGLEGTFSDGP